MLQVSSLCSAAWQIYWKLRKQELKILLSSSNSANKPCPPFPTVAKWAQLHGGPCSGWDASSVLEHWPEKHQQWGAELVSWELISVLDQGEDKNYLEASFASVRSYHACAAWQKGMYACLCVTGSRISKGWRAWRNSSVFILIVSEQLPNFARWNKLLGVL